MKFRLNSEALDFIKVQVNLVDSDWEDHFSPELTVSSVPLLHSEFEWDVQTPCTCYLFANGVQVRRTADQKEFAIANSLSCLRLRVKT